MSTRKPSPRTRAFRPAAEDLENRQLLSGTVAGTDIDGDVWTLTLIGPGSLGVTKQNDASGNPGALNSATEINTITIGGLDPTKSRLVGKVVKGASGDGKVFFQNLVELHSQSEELNGNGIVGIDMPNFWLGNTTPVSSTATSLPAAPAITIPDGVDTLQFGGVDTTHNQPATAPSGSSDDNTAVTLGLPQYGGTRIIIDKSISSTAVAPPASGSTTPTTIQHAVTFDVSGRLDLFQANSIEGDASKPPGQFGNEDANASGFGGTWVVSGTGGTAPFLANGQIQGAVTGQIGNVRVGGNATNFTTLVFDATGTGNAKISNYSVGGETNNVMLVAPNGARNISFGLGMDTAEIYAHVVNSLKANRGALNSNVAVDRTISRMNFGGDVVGSTIVTGVVQNYSNLINAITGQAAVSTFNPTPSPTAPPLPQNAQIGGGMQVLVAGDVTDSVFAASVQPAVITTTGSNGATSTSVQFGTPQDLKLPSGHITAKVEGTIDNSNATPDSPTTAFYAKAVNLQKGPILPPNVPEAPYTGTQPYPRVPGVAHPGRTTTLAARSRHGIASSSLRLGASTPKGPGRRA
jgi:hypothetical protein